MNLMTRLRQLEDGISKRLERHQPRTREPLAVMLAIVDLVEQQTQFAGQGKRVFPFNRIKVSVAARDRGARARLEAVLDDQPTLEQRITDRLAASGCDAGGVSVRLAYVAEPADGWIDPQFHVEFARVAPGREPLPPVEAGSRRIQLTVAAGTAECESSALTAERINIGRCVEVRDGQKKLLQINQVAFHDDAERTNASVSRRHAHIVRDASGHYDVVDDRSARGTSILRHGTTIAVPPGRRGLRLQSGDELILGEAKLRVTIQEVAPKG